MSALVNPIGDFPLDDDWVYALSVKSILQSGRFELPSPATANVFAQSYWGAMFCLPLGFSFTALRFSTLTLGGAGVLVCYLLLREIGAGWWIALLGGLSLAVNPLYFGLAHTFMTDVPFLAIYLGALLFFVRGIQREQPLSLVAGILVALLAVLIRQFALVLLLAFGVAYVLRKGARWNVVAIAALPLVVGAGLNEFFQRWLIETGRTPLVGERLYDLIPSPVFPFVTHSLKLAFFGLPYLGMLSAPLVAGVGLPRIFADTTSQRTLTRLFVAIVAGLLLSMLAVVYTGVPEVGNILTPSGLGPRTLRDTFILGKNFPSVPAAIRVFWFGLIVVSEFAAAGALLHLYCAAADLIKAVRCSERCDASWLQALGLVFAGSYAALLLLVGFQGHLFDRYMLLFLPVMFLLITENSRPLHTAEQRWRAGALSLALLFLYSVISVGATHDFLAWNRARWEATRTLMAAGVSPHQIDGGYEFNGWYLADPHYRAAPKKSYWWVDDDEYVIASGPINGYKELQRFAFRRWLFLSKGSVLILHRVDSGH